LISARRRTQGVESSRGARIYLAVLHRAECSWVPPLLRTSLSDRFDLARRLVMTFDLAEIIGASEAMNDAH
jgi:hypothetical protein